MRASALIALVIGFVAVALQPRALLADTIKLPFVLPAERSHPPQDSAEQNCPPLKPLPEVMPRGGYYVDPPTNSRADPDLVRGYYARTANLRAAEDAIARSLTRAAAERTGVAGAAASCAFAHILSFARQGTFLKSIEWNETGGVRLYATPPILAYAILKSSSQNATEGYPGSRHESEEIERWIRRLADRIKSFMDMKPYGNNIDAWGAAALGSAAVALNDRSYLDHAVSVAAGMLEQVDADGALPREMKRGGRALEYSLFATQALVLVDAIAEANGNLALRATNGGALGRLIDLMVSAAEDPVTFYKIKGIAGYDNAVSQVYRQNLAWLPLAAMMRVDPRIRSLACQHRPLYSVWTAGNWEYYLDRRAECG